MYFGPGGPIPRSFVWIKKRKTITSNEAGVRDVNHIDHMHICTTDFGSWANATIAIDSFAGLRIRLKSPVVIISYHGHEKNTLILLGICPTYPSVFATPILYAYTEC